jgi:predicted RNA binding protein YcfA (HicA-like mRNA interferase family)
MKVREVIALVEADGWYLIRTRGAMATELLYPYRDR